MKVNARGTIAERERYGRAWQARTTALLMRQTKGSVPTVEQLAGIKPIIRRQTPDEVKGVFAAMRAAAP